MTKEQAIKELERFNREGRIFATSVHEAIDIAIKTIKENSAEIKQKDRQIDLMAEFIFQNIDVEEEICNSAYIECKQETAQDITCINCIKQYFEKLAKEKGE